MANSRSPTTIANDRRHTVVDAVKSTEPLIVLSGATAAALRLNNAKLSMETTTNGNSHGAFIDIDASVRIFLQHPQAQDQTNSNEKKNSTEESPK